MAWTGCDLVESVASVQLPRCEEGIRSQIEDFETGFEGARQHRA